jgi:hypothetical protein
MIRERLGLIGVVLGVAALIAWVASNTYWTSIKVPLPLKGEAATNPFYIREKFAQALGAHTQWSRDMRMPPTTGIAYVSMLEWDLLPERRKRFEHWVESGGRLVIGSTLFTSTETLETWMGVGHQKRVEPKTKTKLEDEDENTCYPYVEDGTQESYDVCDMASTIAIVPHRKLEWGLRDKESNLEGARVRVGRGSVTALAGAPFSGRSLFSGDNGRLFVAATQLRRGDVIYFFTESDQASLLELAVRFGWPVLCLIGVALALAIWRGSSRFGPMAPATETARRSLAEQIRGTGQFAMRIGSAGALHAATARALNEAASRYINAYEVLSGADRMQALATATGFEASSLAAALHYSGSGRAEHLRADLELLEAARRRILLKHMRRKHGN